MSVVPWLLGCSGVVICAGVGTDSCSSMSRGDRNVAAASIRAVPK
jgi:hypothetical protein